MALRRYALFLAAMMAAACIRLAPQTAVEEPAAVIDRLVFAAEVAKSGEWAEPRGEKNVFVKGSDAAVFSFLSLKDLAGEHTLAWKWYAPSGRLYRAPEPIAVGRPGQLFARYIAWDEIRLFAERDIGRWTVAIFLDGALALTAGFAIK
jgi:hypothetical protein